jgi:hypothetical protein
MRHGRRNEAGEMNGVMPKGVDVRLFGLKLPSVISAQTSGTGACEMERWLIGWLNVVQGGMQEICG